MKIALGFLAGLHAAVLLAPWLAPYPYDAQHRDFPFAPPSHVHFWDENGRFHRPFVYSWVQDFSTNTYREDRTIFYPIRLWTGGRLLGVDAPAVFFLTGSDGFGRDVFSRLLYGAQVSLFTGLMAALLSVGIGLMLGVASGYFRGWLDQILMRGGELMMALPWLYLLLAVRALLPLHISTVRTFFLLIVIIGSVGWVRPARLVRAVVLAGREADFVLAAKGFGASHWYVIRRHILPITTSVVVAQITILIPQYILAEVSLSFLGLGVGEPVPSWGNMLTEGMQYHALVAHPWLLLPGLATVVVLLGYLVLADALSDHTVTA
ncbi:MAG TPA: ABC transporter permease [Candidatus Sulfopaludibacter sp.]|jgi:peptide/nickel transport system permease protein|nr:ABC transporter permease [Candidatus Sulfopaludibacter sp.]